MFYKLTQLIDGGLISQVKTLLQELHAKLVNVEIITPHDDGGLHYTRNKIYESETMDCFIHAMKPNGKTMIHAHGLNDVIIMPLDGELSFHNYTPILECHNIYQCDISNGTILKGEIYHKKSGVDLIHCIYNLSNEVVKFFELYKKPYGSLPLYIADIADKQIMPLDFTKYSFQVNLDFIEQVKLNAHSVYVEDLSTFKGNFLALLSSEHYILSPDGKLITNLLQLNDLVAQVRCANLQIYTYMDIILINYL